MTKTTGKIKKRVKIAVTWHQHTTGNRPPGSGLSCDNHWAYSG